MSIFILEAGVELNFGEELCWSPSGKFDFFCFSETGAS
jgi:hypothetical protein